MFNSKLFSILNIKNYISLLIFTNFFSILFLNDTTSFNLGLISLHSIIYCLNTFLFVIFIIFETISAYLDFYGVTFKFLQLILIHPENLNLNFNIHIFFVNLSYFFFLIFNLLFLLFIDDVSRILRFLFIKKKIILIGLFITLSLFYYTIKKSNNNYLKSLNFKISNKINFIISGNLFRSDNWYIVFKNTINYKETKSNQAKFSFENEFENFNELNDIYVIINESYPNFKNKVVKEKLLSELFYNLENVEIKKLKKNWSKDYSTQGSEMQLFCDNKGSWKDFNLSLDIFLSKNNCWINKFKDRYNIFIHSYKKTSFSRSRYFENQSSFFKKTYFKEDLLQMGFSTCNKNIYYVGICEDEIINKLLIDVKKIKEKKIIIYLTVENHIPINVQYYKNLKCEDYPLNLHPQFCTLFKNQKNFNIEVNKFINQLNSNDLLVFFSDTPPLLSKRDRIHFEDYIDVFFFKKK